MSNVKCQMSDSFSRLPVRQRSPEPYHQRRSGSHIQYRDRRHLCHEARQRAWIRPSDVRRAQAVVMLSGLEQVDIAVLKPTTIT